MRRGGADRQIGILPRIAERRAGGFGHPFDFERENPQTLHDLRYAGRNHPQILAAGQHRGRIEQRREFAQRFVAPEVVVATVEKLLVQPVERPLLRRREPPVGEGRLRRDTRMVMPETFTVFEEEYVVEQTQQSRRGMRRCRRSGLSPKSRHTPRCVAASGRSVPSAT